MVLFFEKKHRIREKFKETKKYTHFFSFCNLNSLRLAITFNIYTLAPIVRIQIHEILLGKFRVLFLFIELEWTREFATEMLCVLIKGVLWNKKIYHFEYIFEFNY